MNALCESEGKINCEGASKRFLSSLKLFKRQTPKSRKIRGDQNKKKGSGPAGNEGREGKKMHHRREDRDLLTAVEVFLNPKCGCPLPFKWRGSRLRGMGGRAKAQTFSSEHLMTS
jgi:hypothetical protein